MSTNGLFSMGIEKGKADDAKKQARKAKKQGNKPTENGSAKKVEPSLREKLLQTTRMVASANVLRETLKEARDCQATPEIVKGFVDLVRQADELALYHLSLTMSERDARDRWEDLGWKEQEESLQGWALENEAAKAIVANLASFNTNPPLREFLNQVMEWEIPLRGIQTLHGLKKFLDDVAEDGLAHRIVRPSYESERGITITLGRDTIMFLPKKDVAVSTAAWPFVQEAHARCKANQEQLDGLKAKATKGLTPAGISRGQEGTLFLTLSGTQAILLEAYMQGSWMSVKVTESVNLKEDQLPQDSQLWDEKARRPSNTVGKWARIAKALEGWSDRQERATRVYRQERDDKLTPITEVADFGTRFEDQGLTQILKGEVGTAACWMNKFRWGGKEGLFGVAVKHTEEDNYVLMSVVGDFDFPNELIHERLPLVVDHEMPALELERLSVDKKIFLGLKMTEQLLKLRLKAEINIADPGEVASEK